MNPKINLCLSREKNVYFKEGKHEDLIDCFIKKLRNSLYIYSLFDIFK